MKNPFSFGIDQDPEPRAAQQTPIVRTRTTGGPDPFDFDAAVARNPAATATTPRPVPVIEQATLGRDPFDF